MFFELAVRYVFDPHGHGASVEDVKAMYLDIRSGVPFAHAFEDRMGLSVSQYEQDFFELIVGYLEQN
jgi:hypothetical protein